MRKSQLKLPSVGNIIIIAMVVLSIISVMSSTNGRKLNFLGIQTSFGCVRFDVTINRDK